MHLFNRGDLRYLAFAPASHENDRKAVDVAVSEPSGIIAGGHILRDLGEVRVSSIVGEHARVMGAFEEPTLSLLRGTLAPANVAILRSAFPQDQKTQPAARLHQVVDTLLRELRERGLSHVPDGDGREVCMLWVRRRWLTRDVDGTTYTLTSHAMQALGLVRDLTRDRVNLSEHRIKNIVDTANRLSVAANPDLEARKRRIREQIAVGEAELARLDAGGELELVSADYILEGLVELQDLVSGLPIEFARVGEVVESLQEQLRADFRADTRPAGEIVADFLTRADDLTTATAEGRAFEGAFNLLDDDALLDQLRSDIASLVGHPDIATVLSPAEKNAMVGIVGIVRDGARDAMTKIVDTVGTLNTFIRSRNVVEDRELDRVLMQLEAALGPWMQSAGPRVEIPAALLPESAEIAYFREKFYDAAADVPLDPLDDTEPERPDTLSLDDLRRYGGPHLDELSAALDVGAEGDWTVATHVFPNLPDDVRRPVDALGMLHLVADRADLMRTGRTEQYLTRRPDGTEQVLVMPGLSPTSKKDGHDDER